ncbi:MAG: hypothetical protein IKB22_09780, partial [Lentisphaeria bacterium]|nr:hypothetical protein [Lentisphaeria bacterium]
TMAAEYDMPTLFHNDEAWYKDSMAPLLMKDGRYHIPADLLGMFGDLTVSSHQDNDNLLITRGTGAEGTYVSILFSDKTAVIDGRLQENVGIFRENGFTYVDGEWIAEIFSLTCTYARTENGNTVLRLSDAEAARTMEELMTLYREEPMQTAPMPEKEPARTGEDGIRRIYIVTGDNYENPEFTPAEAVVKNSGLVCTMFLHGRSDPEKYWEYAFFGNAGICAGSAEEADAVNDRLESLFCRRLEYVLPAYGDTDREALRQAGYIVVEPDFVVDYSTDPDAIYGELTAFLEENDSVIVKVSGDGCSQRMIALLCNLTADPQLCRTEVLLP